MISESNRKWWILFTMCLLTVMLNFDVTAVNLAIPKIAVDFHANLANMQWVINSFVLLSAMFQILGGRIGDTYGHRKIFVIGTIIFVIASMVAGVATTEWLLILARAGQGLALGLAYPMSIALTYNAFPREQHGVAMGFIMGTMGVWLGIGPTLGGIIIHYIGWRWIFYVNLPIGILTVVLTYIFCYPPKIPKQRESLDYLGASLLILGLLGIVFALNQSQEWGFYSTPFIVIMIAGLLCFVILYYLSKRKIHPIMDFELFKQRNFLLNNIIRIFAQLVFIPVLFFIPIYLQNILGHTPLVSGLFMLYLTVIIGLLSPFAGKFVDRVGFRIPNAISMLAFFIGCLLIYEVTPADTLMLLASGLIFVGVGTGISFVSTTAGALSPISTEKMGLATGILMTVVWVSCAIGISLMGAILALSSKAELLGNLAQKGILLPRVQMNELIRIAQGISPLASLKTLINPSLLPELTRITLSSFMHGFHLGFLVLMFLSILGLILCFLLKKA